MWSLQQSFTEQQQQQQRDPRERWVKAASICQPRFFCHSNSPTLSLSHTHTTPIPHGILDSARSPFQQPAKVKKCLRKIDRVREQQQRQRRRQQQQTNTLDLLCHKSFLPTFNCPQSAPSDTYTFWHRHLSIPIAKLRLVSRLLIHDRRCIAITV